MKQAEALNLNIDRVKNSLSFADEIFVLLKEFGNYSLVWTICLSEVLIMYKLIVFVVSCFRETENRYNFC